MPTNRDDFTKDTKNRAGSRVGFLCSKPDCRCSTIGPSAGNNSLRLLLQHMQSAHRVIERGDY